jgi:hypothetical protein
MYKLSSFSKPRLPLFRHQKLSTKHKLGFDQAAKEKQDAFQANIRHSSTFLGQC